MVLVSITAEIKSRHGSLTLLVLISLDTQWGKSCEGPSPQADLKSFHPVVCKRALESMLAPSVGTDPREVTPPQREATLGGGKGSVLAQIKIKIYPVP